MIERFNLGIIKQDGKIVNHRALVKVLFNPFLRTIGWQIATTHNKETDTLGSLIITRCPKKQLEFSFDYSIEGKEVDKQRIWV